MPFFLMLSKLLASLCFVRNVLGSPATTTVDIKLTTGIFRGVSTPGSTDKFLGIPYAQQPVGNLRFKAPVPITQQSDAVKDASTFGNACPQPPLANVDLGAPVGEDCLHLNIWRPQGLDANAKLPVLFWMHGGAYTVNSASDPAFDPTELIQRSVAIGKPIVFASINYRLNTFGFLASTHVPPEDLNMGLQDQLVALAFVQDNIAAFGGDPAKVTIGGQSVSGGSVQVHFLYPTARRLFRAGIADSSTGPFKNSPDASTYDKSGKPFSQLLEQTGCSAGPSAVSCLQAVPFKMLLNISNTMILNTLNHQVWQPSIGPPGSMITERASAKIQSGDFLHLPYLAGTNINEGTFFSSSLRNLGLSGAAEDAAFVNFIGHLVIDNSTLTDDVINTFLTEFPANDPANGAPFNTGDSLFDRGAAWYTEQMFLSPQRFFFQHASALQPIFGYYFKEFIPGNDITLGVAHSSELELLFGPVPEVAAVDTELSTQMRDFYINFVNDLNPGPQWSAYTARSPRVMQFLRNNVTMIPDDFNVKAVDFSNTQKVLDEFEK
ncbi:alpha/beta-hydrolase [Pholiota conissans]|uniref:Alpha/beta-hydrolase n=1 Tax=Pholiota conissans TaxID=109636 RepID=A0A9P5Z4R1_9AGAR|nr:alpha/beta-hydrolase [Pholiota conissans]